VIPQMDKISHTKIKQPSFGEKRPKLTYTKISRFTVIHMSEKYAFNIKTTNNNFALVLIIAFTGKQSYCNDQYM
jgi:hypothetical protein